MGRNPGWLGQGQGPQGRGEVVWEQEYRPLAEMGGRGVERRLCNPGNFSSKTQSFTHSLILQIPVGHLIHANAEVKDVNVGATTISLMEGTTSVKTFVNTP